MKVKKILASVLGLALATSVFAGVTQANPQVQAAETVQALQAEISSKSV